jgi:UDP-3-O-[3-hydroxymyristoyl] glucosamine N-acyltransferase
VQDKTKSYSLGSLAELLGLTFEGNSELLVTGIATLSSASEDDLSFYHNPLYFSDLQKTRAAVVILSSEAAIECPVPVLLSDNPYAAYARASRLFESSGEINSGIHPSAIIDASALIGNDVSIAANVVIEANVCIEEGCIIGANSVIGNGCSVGKDSLIYPGVTIYPDVRLGERGIFHSGVVIGSDGFGFALDGQTQVKIAQLGGVTIGNDVEIGAGSTIDRGALEDTIIGNGVKIDNQVQIAHNVKIGENTVICGCSAIAGSSTIGKNCIIAGAVGIINHITIVDEVTVTAMSLVNKSITEKGVYSSGTGLSDTSTWKKNIVHFRQLDKLNNRVKLVERHFKNLGKVE